MTLPVGPQTPNNTAVTFFRSGPAPLSAAQIERALKAGNLVSPRWPQPMRYQERNRVIVLLMADAGLTVTEIALLKRQDIMHDGYLVQSIAVPGREQSGRVPMSDRLWQAILTMLGVVEGYAEGALIVPERDPQKGLRHMKPESIAYVLWKIFERAGFLKASSRSLRRAFILHVVANSPIIGLSRTEICDLAGLADERSLKPYEVAASGNLADGHSHAVGQVVAKHRAGRRTLLTPPAAPSPMAYIKPVQTSFLDQLGA